MVLAESFKRGIYKGTNGKLYLMDFLPGSQTLVQCFPLHPREEMSIHPLSDLSDALEGSSCPEAIFQRVFPWHHHNASMILPGTNLVKKGNKKCTVDSVYLEGEKIFVKIHPNGPAIVDTDICQINMLAHWYEADDTEEISRGVA